VPDNSRPVPYNGRVRSNPIHRDIMKQNVPDLQCLFRSLRGWGGGDLSSDTSAVLINARASLSGRGTRETRSFGFSSDRESFNVQPNTSGRLQLTADVHATRDVPNTPVDQGKHWTVTGEWEITAYENLEKRIAHVRNNVTEVSGDVNWTLRCRSSHRNPPASARTREPARLTLVLEAPITSERWRDLLLERSLAGTTTWVTEPLPVGGGAAGGTPAPTRRTPASSTYFQGIEVPLNVAINVYAPAVAETGVEAA
jgi:hypothetical protein